MEAPLTNALTFQETTFDLVEHDSAQLWLRSRQIAGALGYAQPDSITDLYNSNATEFTDSMTALVRLPTAGGAQEVRIFSLRGAHLLGMFARTERAAEFRRWVLDVLERQAAPQALPALPTAAPAPLVGQTFDRVLAERDALRAMLAERVLQEEPHLRKMIRLHNIADLTQAEKAKLMGWEKASTWREHLKRLATLGLVDYTPDPVCVAGGQAGMKMLQAKRKAEGAPKSRAGLDAAGMARLRARAAEKRAARKAQAAATGSNTGSNA